MAGLALRARACRAAARAVNKLCGAARPPLLSRNIASPALVSSIRTTGAVWILAIAYGAPPENAKMPRSGWTSNESVRRTERTGPTTDGTRDWNTAASRV